MCGISVVVNAQPDGSSRDALLKMHHALSHRGPDGEGFLWLDEALQPHSSCGESMSPPAFYATPFCAAFRWLKIQDPSELANQPMCSSDGRIWLLFNGEIYNHVELRDELRRSGDVFTTTSDTEVVLAAYRRWGSDCLSRLRGMWAIVLVDLDRRRAVLSRDRLGIKPLFYARDGARLLIASEAKAVALAQTGGPRADSFRTHEFLRGLPPQSANLTFFRRVFPVPAGTWSEYPLDSGHAADLAFHRYWSLADFRSQHIAEAHFEQTRAEFESLLRSVMDEHSVASVQVGTLLSGGLDTSMLAHLLAERSRQLGQPKPSAFSIIFEDPMMSEWPYMQLVIAQAGLHGVNLTLTPDMAWSAIEIVVGAEGQPLLGQDIIAQHHAYGLARRHNVPVVLDGQGADELLAGLPMYESQIFPELVFNGRWLQLNTELRARMKRYRYSYAEALQIYLKGPISRRWHAMRGHPNYGWLDSGVADSTCYGPGRTKDWGPESSALTRFLYRHVRHTNLPQILTLQDHASMSHGVESRVPFLDHRLVEFIFRLPDQFKLRLGVRKRILLETARRYLPQAVVERRDKRSFVSKVTWVQLRNSRAKDLAEMASSDELRGFGMIDPVKVQQFVTGYLTGRHNDEMAVWRLYTFWHWLRLFHAQL